MVSKVHVKDGRCFEATVAQLQHFIPEWLDSENVTEIYIHKAEHDCIDCMLYEGEAAKALDAEGKPFLGIHAEGECFVLRCDKGTVRGILGEFIDSQSVLEIDVWCAGYADGSTDCQCGAEMLEYLRAGVADG